MIVSIIVGPTEAATDCKILMGAGSRGDPLLTNAKMVWNVFMSSGGNISRECSLLHTFISLGEWVDGVLGKRQQIVRILL